jgi:protein SCO1/2
MRRRDVLWHLAALALGGAAWPARMAWAHGDAADREGVAGRRLVQIPAPAFALTDQDGRPFGLQAWRGRAVAVTFGYTACPDVCPLLAAHFALVQQELPAAARQRTGLLFITTDPEHDTPAVLRAYGSRLGADFTTWKFLTGGLAELRPVWLGFGVRVAKLAGGRVDHTLLTTLVDAEGIRRVNYYGTRWQPQALVRDLLALAQGDRL